MPPRGGRGGRSYWRGGRGRVSWGRGRGGGPRGASTSRAASVAAAGASTGPVLEPSTPSYQRSGSSVASTPRPTTARTRTRTRGGGVAASTTTGPARDQHIICAATEARGIAATVGLAFVNLTTAEAVLCEIADNQTFVKTLHKLHVFDPSEILVAASTAEQQSKLRQVLAANLPPATSPIRGIARKYWDESAGLAYVQALSLREDVEATRVAIEGKYYATCCFAAAMQYVEHMLNLSFAMHSMRIKYEPSEDTMMIDVATIQALELIQNSQNPRSSDSLFGLLNATLTKMGARLLRSSILQPLIDRRVIETRHDALQELTSNADTFVAVRKALRSFQDVDRALTSIVIVDKRSSVHRREQSINNVLAVKHYVRAVPQVHEALSRAASELLINIRRCCLPSTLGEVSRLIDETINEDVTFQSKPLQLRNQRVYAVKAGVSGLLDIARQAYKEANDDASQLMLDLQQLHDINLDMKYDSARQYYFVVHSKELKDRLLPEDFINRLTRKGTVECQTLDLMKLNQKILDSMHEVMNLSDDAVQQLIRNIRINIAPLFRISDGIAVLDMLAAFGQVTTTQDYCRPEFSSTLGIKNGRHAVAEKLCRAKFVPNDVYATDSKRLQIVTGCNMSGKSTYIRAIALATVMAQIGCFVPADYASFNLRTQLFARVSVDDSATSGVSTFAAEMRETAFILRNVDAGSLVIVDELGRGTSTRDGLAIAAAVAEALLHAGALVWFVTHFRDLPLMFAERPGVATMHLRTSRPDADAMAMLYTVADGPAHEPHYGLTLARAVGLPENVIAAATRVAEALERRQAARRAQHVPTEQILVARRRKLLRALHEQLVQAQEGGLRGAELRRWLRGLQTEFVRRMADIDIDEFGSGRARSEDSDVIEVPPPVLPPSIPPPSIPETDLVSETDVTPHRSLRSQSCASSVTVTGEGSSEWRDLEEEETEGYGDRVDVVDMTEDEDDRGAGGSSVRSMIVSSFRRRYEEHSAPAIEQSEGSLSAMDVPESSDVAESDVVDMVGGDRDGPSTQKEEVEEQRSRGDESRWDNGYGVKQEDEDEAEVEEAEKYAEEAEQYVEEAERFAEEAEQYAEEAKTYAEEAEIHKEEAEQHAEDAEMYDDHNGGNDGDEEAGEEHETEDEDGGGDDDEASEEEDAEGEDEEDDDEDMYEADIDDTLFDEFLHRGALAD